MAERNLQDYERKRDFRRTPEPRGAPSGAGCSPRFVIQIARCDLTTLRLQYPTTSGSRRAHRLTTGYVRSLGIRGGRVGMHPCTTAFDEQGE